MGEIEMSTKWRAEDRYSLQSQQRWLNRVTNGNQVAAAEIRVLQEDLRRERLRIAELEHAAQNFRNYVRALTQNKIDSSIIEAIGQWRDPKMDLLPHLYVYEAGDLLPVDNRFMPHPQFRGQPAERATEPLFMTRKGMLAAFWGGG